MHVRYSFQKLSTAAWSNPCTSHPKLSHSRFANVYLSMGSKDSAAAKGNSPENQHPSRALTASRRQCVQGERRVVSVLVDAI